MFTESDIDNMFRERVAIIERLIIDRLIYVGESFVNAARSSGDYTDQTGNLRSSIGYIIMYDGTVINKNFQQANKGSDKQSGVNEGQKYINELKKLYKKGYVLIVVAGMNYAAAVESKGKDVLTGSSIKAKEQLKKALKLNIR